MPSREDAGPREWSLVLECLIANGTAEAASCCVLCMVAPTLRSAVAAHAPPPRQALVDAIEAGNRHDAWCARADANQMGPFGMMPLMAAAHLGDAALVRLLLSARADVNRARTSDDLRNGFTALHFAAYKGSVACVDALIDAAACVNALDSFRRSALFYADDRGNARCAAMLRQRGGQLQHLDGAERPMWDLSADYARDPEATDRDIETAPAMPAIAEVV